VLWQKFLYLKGRRGTSGEADVGLTLFPSMGGWCEWMGQWDVKNIPGWRNSAQRHVL
jgi:hypothetical protein